MNRYSSDPYAVFQGIILMGVMASAVAHSGYFEVMTMRYQGYCPHCGYKLNHPIVKHDDIIGECGWR